MKKIIVALLLALLVFTACACDNNTQKPEQNTPAPSTAPSDGDQGTGTIPNTSQNPTQGADDIENTVPGEIYMKPGDVYKIYMYNLENDATLEERYDGDEPRDDLHIEKGEEMRQKYGVDVTFTAWKGSYFTEYCAAAAAGAPLADILYTVGPHTLGQLYMWDGIAGNAMLPISDYSHAYTFDNPEYWDVDSQNARCYYGNKLYFVVPRLIGDNIVNLNQYTFYNKSILSEAGYEADEMVKLAKEGNWTWDKFKEVAIATNDPDKYVYALVTGQENSLAYNLMASNGADYFKKKEVNGQMIDRYTGDEPECLEAWDFFMELADANLIMPQSMGGEDIMFRSGMVAMMLTHLNRSDTYRDYPELEFGILPIPKAPNAEGYVSTLNWFMPYGIFKGVKNPEGVVQFAGLFLAPAYGLNSTENTMLMQSELSTRLGDPDSVQFVLDSLNYTAPSNTLIYQTECAEYLWYATESFLKGETTPAVHFQSIADQINYKIDQYNGLAD